MSSYKLQIICAASRESPNRYVRRLHARGGASYRTRVTANLSDTYGWYRSAYDILHAAGRLKNAGVSVCPIENKESQILEIEPML